MFCVSRILILGSIFISVASFAAGVQVDITLSPIGKFQMLVNKVTGHAYKTADGFAAENVVVDLRGLTTGMSLRDKHTKDRLLVEKFPEAKLLRASGKGGQGVATIQIRGKQQEVKGTYTVEGETLKAKFPMDIRALDINDARYGSVGVKDIVTVNIELPITKK